MNHFTRTTAMLAACVALAAGCGATVEQATPATGAAVTVTNCAAPLTVPHRPRRVVSNDTGITELLFALGLSDSMVGYTTYDGKGADYRTSPWKADFDDTRDLGTAFTREVIQAANPDFVFAGWNYGFRESTGVTPDWIREIGAIPYQLTEACRQAGGTQRGIMAPLEALYQDIANLGIIFGVQRRADALINDYRRRIHRAQAGAPVDDKRARVFVFDSATPDPFTAGGTATPQALIEAAGGTNVFAGLHDSWVSTSWEAAAHADPQVIVIVDYGVGPENTVEAKINLLRAHPLMANTTAIRDNNVLALPYAAMVEGPRAPDSVETLAAFLRSKGY